MEAKILDDPARKVAALREAREGDFTKSCLNCTAFKYVSGPIPHAASGECRASIPKSGGNKFAAVRGADWCRDGFEAFDTGDDGGA